MFRALPMQHLELHLLHEQLPHAALALAESGVFHPDPAARSELDTIPGDGYRQLFHDADTRLSKILTHYGLDSSRIAPCVDARSDVITTRKLAELNTELGILWAACSAWQEDLRKTLEARKSVDELLTALDIFARLQVDLGQLRREHHFLTLRIGAMPKDNTRRLGEALGLATHLLQVFLVRDRLAYVVVAGISDHQATSQIDSVLETAGFRVLDLPAELSAELAPSQDNDAAAIRDRLLGRKQAADREHDRLQTLRHAQLTELTPRLAELCHTLTMARPWAELSPLVGTHGGLALIRGWAPLDAIADIEAGLHQRIPDAWMLRRRDPKFTERDITPVLMARPAWLQSFTSLVRNFGVPRYGEIDPTAFFTLTFLLLFGMMFGDVGHGLVIAAAGLGLWRHGGSRLATLPLLAGGSSIFFGLLYGSVFGFEHVIPALWMSPLHDPIAMMQIAAWLGVGFIALTTLMNVINRIIDRDWRSAFMAGNGIAGLIFYLGMIASIAAALSDMPLPGHLVAALLGTPASVFITQQWRRAEGGIGERLMITLIETFETVMGYVSGTLSFLRVAAFGLNHVALAIAVFTLADMLGDFGHWLMVIGGNIFILVLEGAIVAIQVLRLEYYEGFSRFFGGRGRAFQPMALSPAPNIN